MNLKIFVYFGQLGRIVQYFYGLQEKLFWTCTIPLVHIDTRFKIPEMIQHRDNIAERSGREQIEERCRRNSNPFVGNRHF